MNNGLAIFTSETETNVVGRIPENEAEKAAVVNALSAPSSSLEVMVNQEIMLTNYYLERVNITDRETGEIQNLIRTVLIDANGASYGSISKGVSNGLKAIISIYGPASEWPSPIPVRISQQQVGRGRMYCLRVAQ